MRTSLACEAAAAFILADPGSPNKSVGAQRARSAGWRNT
jgi:hypothetical protein